MASGATAKKATAKKAAAEKPAAKKAASKKTPPHGKPPEKDPEGGLTATGRRAFHEQDGSNLKPGVGKAEADMTPEEMKRKGSWAARFYGRKSLPPLLDKKGEPTRFALSAHAWGEPVPKTEAEARKIAEKGRALLARYRKEKAD